MGTHRGIGPGGICGGSGTRLPAGAQRILRGSTAGPDMPLSPKRRASEVSRQNGDEELVLKLLPLVKRMAQQMRERLPLHVEIDDLVSTGTLGLVDAVRKFDRGKEVKLESYARHRIRGAILDGLRSIDSASRDMRKKEKKAARVYRSLEVRLGRPPGDAEIADALGITLAKWYRTVRELQGVGFDWLRPMSSVGVKEPREPSGESLPANGEDTQFDGCYRREQRDLLGRAMTRLSERERQIIELYYRHDLTMKQIGRKLGIDESRVSQLHSAALVRLRARITDFLRHPRPTVPWPA